ncbi:MAG: MGMT family protein [Verrucomicrobia subdivision 3 bacterium]|nr:MGMT family protein [Limisphaerales bacterium]
MEKYYGCSGKMFKPSPSTVASLVKAIPNGRVVTIDAVYKKLAKKYKTEIACPATSEKSLCLAAAESVEKNTRLPYWRVLKKSGELIQKFPDGIKGHAACLAKEGHKIVSTSKSKGVQDFEVFYINCRGRQEWKRI